MAYVPRTNLYAPLEMLRRQLGIDANDTVDDVALLRTLEQVSRSIDAKLVTQFYVETSTEYATATESGRLLLEKPLLSVTSLATDDGSRDYLTSWAVTDFDLLPFGAPTRGWPPSPYWQIAVAPYGAYRFGGYSRGVRITGKWGHYEILARSPVTVNAGQGQQISASQTNIPLSAAPALGDFGVGSTLLLGTEQLGVTAIATSPSVVATAVRGLNGTTAAVHAHGDAFDVYSYPVVDECCLLQAADDWRYRSILGGERSSDEIGEATSEQAWLPKVRQKLWVLRSGLGMVA